MCNYWLQKYTLFKSRIWHSKTTFCSALNDMWSLPIKTLFSAILERWCTPLSEESGGTGSRVKDFFPYTTHVALAKDNSLTPVRQISWIKTITLRNVGVYVYHVSNNETFDIALGDTWWDIGRLLIYSKSLHIWHIYVLNL